MPLNRRALTLLLMSAFAGSLAAQTPPADEAPADRPAACMTASSDPVFADLQTHREEWQARYRSRRAEFRPKMLAHADDISRCVERALRRDLGANSRTTLGVQVAPAGTLARIAVLESNHANNLYGNCLIRVLCQIQLSPPSAAVPEVFIFSINMRRQAGAHQRPWSLDPQP